MKNTKAFTLKMLLWIAVLMGCMATNLSLNQKLEKALKEVEEQRAYSLELARSRSAMSSELSNAIWIACKGKYKCFQDSVREGIKMHRENP